MKKKPGKLLHGHAETPSRCDICGHARNKKVHMRCSRIRQERHQQMLRNEAFDNALMFDKKE